MTNNDKPLFRQCPECGSKEWMIEQTKKGEIMTLTCVDCSYESNEV